MIKGKCVACGDPVHGGQVGCGICIAIYMNPCQGCKDRVASPNCHDKCKRFGIKKAIDAAIKAKIKTEADVDMVSRTGRDRCIKRNHRKVKIRPKGDWKS